MKLRIHSNFRLLVNILVILGTLVLVLNFKQIQAFGQAKFDQYLTHSDCDSPLPYQIGQVDSRFGLTEAKFSADIKEAADIWAQAYQKQLFIDNPSDKALTINLVFDQRASLNNQIKDLSIQVKQKNHSLRSDVDSYHKKEADFKIKLDDFNNQVKSLNQQINDWNEKGGAPSDEYQKLTQQQNDLINQQRLLQTEADNLNRIAQGLNLSTKDYNTDVKTLNKTISTFDNALVQKPEEGIFNASSNTINIYFDNGHNELIHTLAHEMGHALGIPHNQNQEALMYPYSTQSIVPSEEDLNDLNTVCSVRYLNSPFLQNISDLINFYETKVSGFLF